MTACACEWAGCAAHEFADAPSLAEHIVARHIPPDGLDKIACRWAGCGVAPAGARRLQQHITASQPAAHASACR